MRLAQYQRDFQATILARTFAPHDARIARGLAVHHKHFWMRMHDYVAYRYPLVLRYLGDPELTELVRDYIAAHPPTSYALSAIVERLVEFVGAAPPWSGWPVLAELAAFDFRRSALRLCAEEATLTADDVCGLRPDAVAQLHVRLKKRATVATTRLDVCPERLAVLARDAALDHDTHYWLIHIGPRGLVTRRIEPRIHAALEQLQQGTTFGVFVRGLAAAGFAAVEIDRFVDRCVGEELLVAKESS